MTKEQKAALRTVIDAALLRAHSLIRELGRLRFYSVLGFVKMADVFSLEERLHRELFSICESVELLQRTSGKPPKDHKRVFAAWFEKRSGGDRRAVAETLYGKKNLRDHDVNNAYTIVKEYERRLPASIRAHSRKPTE